MAIRTLSVCSGVGGLDLGLHLAGGARTVCYVEREAFAASVLVDRMEETALDPAPVWDDLTTFDGRPWRGKVDLIAGGIPCQPYSLAGKREGNADERALWPEIVRLCREIEPAVVFLEEVPGFLSECEPLWTELRDLGFEWEEPLHATAAQFGAPHDRLRVFLWASHPDRLALRQEQGRVEPGRAREGEPGAPGDRHASRLQGGPDPGETGRAQPDAGSRGAPHPHGERQCFIGCGWVFDGERQALRYDPDGCGDRCAVHGSPWEAESPAVRVDAGDARWVDEIRALGGIGTPPLVYAHAFRTFLRPS